jgi:hypothetical protein
MHPTERITSDDPEEVAQAIQKNYDRTTTWKCYYRLVVESWRNESKYAQIPYCLSETDVAELAHALKRDPVEYQSSCMQVWPFLEYVVNKWGEFLVKNTTGRNHVQALKLLNRS